MAFDHANLTRMGGSGDQQLFLYRTADLLTGSAGVDVNESGYFNSVINDLNVGDIILAVTGIGGTVVASLLVVTSVTTNVTVTDNTTQT